MKLGQLRSIGHNIADSLASGIGLMIGVYAMDVFGEARRSPERSIDVDFLKGVVTAGRASRGSRSAVALYAKALPSLCVKHGCSVGDFRSLSAKFFEGNLGPQFDVTVEDRFGRRVTDEWVGSPGKHILTLDATGHIRRKRSRVSRPVVGRSERSAKTNRDR
jgi:hypothetical protein